MTNTGDKDYKIEQSLRLSELLIGVPFAIKMLQYRKSPFFLVGGGFALFVGALYTLEQYERAKANKQQEGE